MVKEFDKKIVRDTLLRKLCSKLRIFEKAEKCKVPKSMAFYGPTKEREVIDVDFIRAFLRLQANFSIREAGEFNMFLLSDPIIKKWTSNDLLMEELRINAVVVNTMLRFRKK